MKYFAYGSNMNPKKMTDRQIAFSQREKGIIKGYRLEFNKVAFRNPKEGYANIVRDENRVVEGALYDITDSDIAKLDTYEGFPGNYDRTKVKSETVSGRVYEAVTYIAKPDKIIAGLKPSRDYLDHLLAAKDILSKSYYNKLKVEKTLD